MRIRAIYAADEAVGQAPAAERPALRQHHVRPLVTSFFDWARGARQNAQGRNLATKALGYAANQEAELLRVLDDVNLPLENTRSERVCVKDTRLIRAGYGLKKPPLISRERST